MIHDGLYKALALAYYPGRFRRVSLTLIAKKLGAVSKGGERMMNIIRFGAVRGASSQTSLVVVATRRRDFAQREVWWISSSVTKASASSVDKSVTNAKPGPSNTEAEEMESGVGVAPATIAEPKLADALGPEHVVLSTEGKAATRSVLVMRKGLDGGAAQAEHTESNKGADNANFALERGRATQIA